MQVAFFNCAGELCKFVEFSAVLDLMTKKFKAGHSALPGLLQNWLLLSCVTVSRSDGFQNLGQFGVQFLGLYKKVSSILEFLCSRPSLVTSSSWRRTLIGLTQSWFGPWAIMETSS